MKTELFPLEGAEFDTPPTDHPALVRLSKAEQFLAIAKDLSDFKKIISIAEAARVYARAAGLGETVAAHAAEIKLKAQRKAGHFLSKLEKGQGGRPTKNSHQLGVSSYRAAIADVGIPNTVAQRYQHVAAVPEKKFNGYLQEARESAKEATTAGLIKEARQERKKEEKEAIVERISKEAIKFPKGPYRVICIDPPWPYASRADDGTHRARNPYPDMTLEQIKALPIPDLAHSNSIIWLWCTNSFMEEAFDCLKTWEFRKKTILTWAKDRMGTGDWLRGRTEHCLMAIRGKPTVTLTNQSTLLEAKVREHSRKPDEFFELVNSLCPGNRLEMFAREARRGWTAWGGETELYDAAEA